MASGNCGGEPPDDRRSSKSLSSSKMPSRREVKYVYQLPYSVLRELCRVIDCNEKWEELGGTYLGFDIPTLFEFRRPAFHGLGGGSPAEAMLSRWGQRDGGLDRLFVYLAHMEFAWAMRIIHPYVSDKVRHLLPDQGCTTLLDNFERGFTPKLRHPNEASETTSFRSSPPKHAGHYKESSSFYNSNSSKSRITRQEPMPAYAAGAMQGSHYTPNPSQHQYHNPQPRQQHRVPIEQTASFPDSNVTATPQSQAETNNLDKFHKELAQSPQVDAFHPSDQEHSEKIINIDARPSEERNIERPLHRPLVDRPPDERRPLERQFGHSPPTQSPRPSVERPPLFHIQQSPHHNNFPPRKMSNDSPRANEEGGSSPNRRPSDTPSLTYASLPSVPFKEVQVATHDFSTKVLGRGGFGTVFSGIWRNTPVAIKLIKKKDNPGVETLDAAKFKQSLNELHISDWCRHDNILPLYGYAVNDEGLCLVYQLMVNGSLEDRLRCKDNSPPLTWLQRCRIVRGAACGIQFLHALERPLIHGDIKSANILLDKSLEPKLGDFGLVREGPPDAQTHMYVDYIHGTRAYLPPEYMRNRKLSTKVDTYSFGVVLFEVASGQRALDDRRPKNRKNLFDYVHEIDTQKLDQLRDRRAGEESADLFHTFIAMGKQCTMERRHRPEMVHVFHRLDNYLNVHEIKSKAGKSSAVTKSVDQRELSPYERQLLHDRQKESQVRKAKEAECNNVPMADTRDAASKYPANKNECYRSPGRQATEQTVPHCNLTYESQPTYPLGAPIHRATKPAVQCSINSHPPTYEEAMNEQQVKPVEMTLQKTVRPVASELQEPSPQKSTTPPCTPGTAGFLPNLTVLGIKKEVPMGSNGDGGYISYAEPPVEDSHRSSGSIEDGAVGGVSKAEASWDYFQQELTPYAAAGGVFDQDNEVSALVDKLSLLSDLQENDESGREQ